ncbi:hypothetical protein HPB50_023647 [Hyalomma asiaticum]|uniref:Uncharacterized protein n=1 Tax=Hyalomma asiaticum TaxID=266040 RepID=A0ACB7T6U1_HYAAI|nr:hypothetical protein HPB50_023647 [Hyalomma asiaticum]
MRRPLVRPLGTALTPSPVVGDRLSEAARIAVVAGRTAAAASRQGSVGLTLGRRDVSRGADVRPRSHIGEPRKRDVWNRFHLSAVDARGGRSVVIVIPSVARGLPLSTRHDRLARHNLMQASPIHRGSTEQCHAMLLSGRAALLPA